MTTPSSPDDRDPRVAEWLAVEPLDEVTRARLVRDALDGARARGDRPARPRAARIVAVAAALVVAIAVGVTALVVDGDDTSEPTAANAPATRDAPADDAQPDAATPQAGSAESRERGSRNLDAAPSELGDLGDVSTPAALASAARAASPTAFQQFSSPSCAIEVAAQVGRPVATGTGTVEGERVVVVVVDLDDGRRRALTVFEQSCEPGPAVTLR